MGSAKQDAITIAVRQGNAHKKVLKLFFSKQQTDFYVALPYLKLNHYRCKLCEQPDGAESATFDMMTDSITSSTPVKFSYHESGQVHFKPVNPNQSLDPKLRLAQIKVKPIKDLQGEHIFTVLFEGLDAFEDVKSKDAKSSTLMTVDAPNNMINFKILGYAGFSEDCLLNKVPNTASPHVTISFSRPHLSEPLRLGIYILGGATSLRTDGNKPFIIALTGFDTTGNNMRYLALQAAE